MNILYGLYRPDEGEIRVSGQQVSFNSAKDAIDARHRDGAPALHADPGDDGGREHRPRRRSRRTGGVLLDYDEAVERVREISGRFGLTVNPTAKVENISVGQQQRVEILKALYRGAEILILDEPTAVLTPQEASELFEITRSLQADGNSIIFISHKLNEVLEIADRITVSVAARRSTRFRVRARPRRGSRR